MKLTIDELIELSKLINKHYVISQDDFLRDIQRIIRVCDDSPNDLVGYLTSFYLDNIALEETK